jgi:putative addiction module component (TIGR02574 family)
MASGDPMTKYEVDKLLKLPAEERLEIAQVLWNSVDPEDEARFLCLPDWQRRILQDRLADLERNPDDEQPWDQVKDELWPRG